MAAHHPVAAAAETASELPGKVITVFTRHEAGYHTFRIPALVQALDGTLLAFAEGRVDSPADNGNIDLVLRRSTDGGTTWGPVQLVADVGGVKIGNPVPVVDRATGRIVLTSTRTGNVSAHDISCGTADPDDRPRAMVQYSDDNGATWSQPAAITQEAVPDAWRSLVGGPGKGIQLHQGRHAGRLLVPGRFVAAPPPDSGRLCSTGADSGNHVLVSDDGGTTWSLGAVTDQTPPGLLPNEVSVVELADGTVYFSSRDQGTSRSHRLDTTSSDGGTSFDAPYAPVNGVATSRVQGSLVRLPATASARHRVLLTVPDHPTARENLTLWSSFDAGATWRRSCQVHDGPSGYSDTTVLGAGHEREVGVLFEAGDRLYTDDETRLSYSHDIRFARISERRLDLPWPPTLVTPDAIRGQDARVSGAPELTSGRFGQGLALAGDYVVLPLSDALAFGDGPFTAAMWFRSAYRANSLALFYAYAQYGHEPKWWLRVEPGNRIRAQLETDIESRTVDAPGDYADGQWHHVALTRDQAAISVYVDGALRGSGAPVRGSVSGDHPPVGIRVGVRMDGINYPLVGDIDEVWLFGTALGAEQVAQLASTNTVDGARPVAHLPLERLTR